MKTLSYLRSGLVLALMLPGFMPLTASAAVGGSLIKGASDSAVYFVASGKRYAFPNERVYKSWYADFSGVVTVPNAELAQYTLAANVTYRPGSKLIKMATDPKVYAVSRYGVLRWMMTEETAKQTYGADWSQKVDDVADTFFTNYVIGSPIGTAADFNPNEESAISSFDDNIRPLNYSVPLLPTSTPPISSAYVSVSVSTAEATLNQLVIVGAKVSGNTRPISKIEFYDGRSGSPIYTCYSSTTCSSTVTISSVPYSARYRAVATDDLGTKIETPSDQQAPLNAPAISTNLILDATPLTITNGARVNWTSNANYFGAVTSHKVYALIPGEPNPILWKDCGTQLLCSSSSPVYRTTQIFSKVISGTEYRSAALTINAINGTTPKPTLTFLNKPVLNQASMRLDAPSGEGIGWSTIVEGSNPDNDAIAICDSSSCEITVQVGRATSFTGFTDVGGKLEGSNTLYIEP